MVVYGQVAVFEVVEAYGLGLETEVMNLLKTQSFLEAVVLC